MKVCTKCKIEKNLTEFSKSSGCAGGLRPECRECKSAIDRAYRLKNKEAVSARKSEYYEKNKETLKVYYAGWRVGNMDKIRINQKRWADENRDQENARTAKWKAENPDCRRIYNHNRRSLLAGADGSHSTEDINDIFSKQRGFCASCSKKLFKSGKKKYHVDHIQPLSKGGSNWPDNLQCLCPTCNQRKHAKDPLDWAKEIGKLL